MFPRNFDMHKEDDTLHIIDYILLKTDPNDYNVKHFRYIRGSRKKYKLDDVIKYCESCNRTWSKVPEWVDKTQIRIYPKGNMPTIGKQRKKCAECNKKIKNYKLNKNRGPLNEL